MKDPNYTDSVNEESLKSLSAAEADGTENKTYKIGFIITLPVFMGYACCFSLQKKLSVVFGLTEGVVGTKIAKLFGVAVSFVYIFNLIFRVLGHNIVFGFLSPRNRVIAALSSMIISMTMLSVLSIVKWEKPPHVAWVFIAYAFAGVCEGTYGPNMLNIVNHLGNTRLWVVMAMPLGVALITLLGFGLMAVGVPFYAFYLFTVCIAIIGIIIYICTIYPQALLADEHGSKFDLKQFGRDFLKVKDWFPKIWLHSLIFLTNMVCLAMFNPGCTLYAYNFRVNFKLFGFSMPNDWFIFLYNTGAFIGDFVSRRVMEKKKIINPLFYFLLLIFGIAINLSLIPEIAVFAAFFLMWANGGLYVQSTKKIGELFKVDYHLTATSTWLFIGDAGSTTGSNLIQFIIPYIAYLKKIMY